MTTQTTSVSTPPTEEKFQSGNIVSIVGGHFVHDTFTAFLPSLLPLLIQKLSLSLTLAGALQIFVQMPALINPFIGYLADSVSLRYFVILAPAVTATTMSLLGLAPNYTILAILLFVTGVSVACFHAPAPAMIGRISGQQLGKGMSWFMAGGELGRAMGPLLVAWAIAFFTLEGMFPVMLIGWMASLILYWRLRQIPANTGKRQNIWAVLPQVSRLFIPIAFIAIGRAFMIIPMQVYLPTFLSFEGSTLIGAGFALTIWELAGVGGALLGGTLSDRFGRKPVLIFALAVSPMLTLVFLQVYTWLLVPILIVHGIIALSTNPVLMATVQEHMPNNRAVGNGLFISVAFLSRPIVAIAIGYLGDQFGLESAYFWGALISLLAIPAVLYLPNLDQRMISD